MSRVSRRFLLCCSAVLFLESAPVAQEHSYAPADIENGGRLYQSSCAGCHGPSGDSVPGVELARGQFRRAVSDSDLIAIVRSGIPGTTMPPSGFSEAQAATIVAYLRNVAPASGRDTSARAIPAGDAARGKALFDGKGKCATCHRVNGIGPRVAPDLSEIGVLRPPIELTQKLLDPNALVRPGNRFVQAVTTGGATISGRLLNQDSFSIQLIDSSERLISFSKSNLREYSFVKTSPMPSYRDQLTSGELSDLVSYLVSLKGLRP